MKRSVVILAALLVTALPAVAQPYYVTGQFAGWNPGDPTFQMADMGGWYQYTVTNATGVNEFKVTNGAWPPDGAAWPGDNAKADFGDGNFAINFYPGAQGDGWFPPENRVGYVDKELHGWEVMGSFNGWSEPFATLAPLGNGLYSGSAVVADAGDYFFKFRKAGDWDIAIGDDFSNFGHDIAWSTSQPNELLIFELDLAGGRWRVVPEPTSLLGLLVLSLIRRR